MDICQSEKDGDLQAKLQAIKTAEEEDFGHSYIGQVSKLSNPHTPTCYVKLWLYCMRRPGPGCGRRWSTRTRAAWRRCWPGSPSPWSSSPPSHSSSPPQASSRPYRVAWYFPHHHLFTYLSHHTSEMQIIGIIKIPMAFWSCRKDIHF